MSPNSDLVHLSRLQIELSPDPDVVTQTSHTYGSESGATPSRRRITVQQTWQKRRTLGQGGFGTVYLQECIKCTQGENQGQIRAIKQVKKSKYTNYNRELEAIALFSHPKYQERFVESYGWYETENSVFVTMEYLANGDLEKYIVNSLPENQARQIILQVMEALSMMHERSYTHRDLKPANILVSNPGPNWWVKLADFGVSKRAESGITDLRTRVYTPAFAAPEVLQQQSQEDESDDDELTYTNAVDIWASGMIALLILVGEDTFVNRRARRKLINKGELPTDELSEKHLSGDALSFLKNALQIDPKNRPSAAECLKHEWLVFPENSSLQAETIQKSDGPMPCLPTIDESITQPAITEIVPEAAYSARWTTDPTRLDETSTKWKSVATEPGWESSTNDAISIMTNKPNESATRMIDYSQANTFLQDHRITHENEWDRSSAQPSQSTSSSGTETPFWKIVKPDSTSSSSFTDISADTEDEISCIAVSPDCRVIAAATKPARSKPAEVRLYNVEIGTEMKLSPCGPHLLQQIVFSDDNHQLVLSDLEGGVQVWRVGSKEPLFMCPPQSKGLGRTVAVFFPDSWRFILGHPIGALTLYERNGHPIWNAAPEAGWSGSEFFDKQFDCISFSPNGNMLVTGRRDGVWTWNPKNGEPLARIIPFRAVSFAFSPDGRLFGLIGMKLERKPSPETDLIVLKTAAWEVTVLWRDSACFDLAFLRDSEMMALNGLPDRIYLMSARAGKQFRPIFSADRSSSSVHLSPDGRRMAMASTRKVIRVYDLMPWDNPLVYQAGMPPLSSLPKLGQASDDAVYDAARRIKSFFRKRKESQNCEDEVAEERLLPVGWERRHTLDGRIYYVDCNTESST